MTSVDTQIPLAPVGLTPRTDDTERVETVDEKPAEKESLGFVLREQVGAMMKSLRAPPPVLDDLSPFATKADVVIFTDAEARQTARRTMDRNTLNLAEFAIANEARLETVEDPEVQAGWAELTDFLLHYQHLRILKEAS